MPNNVIYVAVIERVPGKEFRAHFPDFPEVGTHDVTIDGVAARGGRVLRAHIDELLQANERVPRPTSIGDVKADGRYRHGFLLQIEAQVPESRLYTPDRSGAESDEAASTPEASD